MGNAENIFGGLHTADVRFSQTSEIMKGCCVRFSYVKHCLANVGNELGYKWAALERFPRMYRTMTYVLGFVVDLRRQPWTDATTNASIWLLGLKRYLVP